MIGPLLDEGDGVRVDISGGFSVVDTNGGTSTAGIVFESDGDVVKTNSLGNTDAGDWISPKAAAPGTYEIMAHQESGDALDGGSSALDTWLVLTSSRSWSITQIGAGAKSATLTVSIRIGSVVLSSGSGTLSATAL